MVTERIRKSVVAGVAFVCAVTLQACSLSYNTVAGFDDYSGVFEGVVSVTPGGVGSITLHEIGGEITCSGSTWVLYKPGGLTKRGARGAAVVECSDARVVQAKWVQTEEDGGLGRGLDQKGNRFHFRYDLDPGVLAQYRKSILARASTKEKAPPVYRPKETRQEKGFSTGTAFFISGSGHAITNHHVIDDAREIEIVMNDGTSHPATLLASDPANDISLIKIDARTRPLPLAKSSGAARGNEVLVLGYPLVSLQGQSQKATFGRINALSGIRDDIRFFQIDAPIQPGNSGGPLIDEYGNVIGVVTSTLSEIVALRASGALPQNVNYAVKSAYIFPLLDGKLGANAPMKSQAAPKDMAGIVSASEGSVGLVIAR